MSIGIDNNQFSRQLESIEKGIETTNEFIENVSQRLEQIDVELRDFIVDLLDETISNIRFERIVNSILFTSLFFLVFFSFTFISISVVLTRSFNFHYHRYTFPVFVSATTICLFLSVFIQYSIHNDLMSIINPIV